MEEINKRVIELRLHLKKNQSQFAREIGLTSALINKLEAGKVKVTESNIRLICLTFKTNEEWLRDGIGKMLNEESICTEEGKRLMVLFDKLSPRARQMLIEYAEKLLADEAALRGEATPEQKRASSA